ncbi:MFS transporter [Siphonobacter sp. SORGH_AS_0500]|uniref:MFS transporter n=1 Tax=Siphonobacter sp. SORGH_AS_0500 TaxID=1864824 RepID=UPI00350FDC79
MLGAFFVQTGSQFYVLAFIVGLVMGGIQALSRSTYAKLLPVNTNDTASFFSFYDVCDKISTVIGTFAFGVVIQLTGSMRYSVLVIAAVFVVGLIVLMRIITLQKQKKAFISL